MDKTSICMGTLRTAAASDTVWHHSQQFFSSTWFLFMLGVKKYTYLNRTACKNWNPPWQRTNLASLYITLYGECTLGSGAKRKHRYTHTHTRFPRRKQMTLTLPRSLLAFVSRRIYLHKNNKHNNGLNIPIKSASEFWNWFVSKPV